MRSMSLVGKYGLNQVARSGHQVKWCYKTESRSEELTKILHSHLGTHTFETLSYHVRSLPAPWFHHAVKELRPQGQVMCMHWKTWPGTWPTASTGYGHESEDPFMKFQSVLEATPAFQSSKQRSQTSRLRGKISFWWPFWILDPKICEQNKMIFFFFW